MKGKALFQLLRACSSNAAVETLSCTCKNLIDAKALSTDLADLKDLNKNSAKHIKVCALAGKSVNEKCKANAMYNNQCEKRFATVPGLNACDCLCFAALLNALRSAIEVE